MDRKIVYFLILILIVSIICGCTQKTQENSSITLGEKNTMSNETISENTLLITNWSRYIDVDKRVSIDVPVNFVVETMPRELKIRSQPRKQEEENNITWIMDSPFNDIPLSNLDWRSITNFTPMVSDIIIDITISDKGDPTESANARVEYTSKMKPNIKTSLNDILIGGIPAKQVIFEAPNQPYWVENYLLFNGVWYKISYGEYEIGQYNQKTNVVSHMIDTLKFIDPKTVTTEPGINYITARPTIQPVANFKEVLNETITLKSGDIKKYVNSYGEFAVIEIKSDSPLSISTQNVNLMENLGYELTQVKRRLDKDVVLINNKNNPAQVSIKVETVECQGDPPLACYSGIRYFSK